MRTNLLKSFITFLSTSMLFIGAYAQTTTFNSGSGNFLVPCGITSITVQIWGGGGGGGGDTGNNNTGGAGGGAGGYSTRVFAVTPGQSLAYSVGAGGTAGTGGGGTGGVTTFSTLTANGGTGGGGNGGAAGTGGTASGGTTNTSGAGGSANAGAVGGAGGAAAGGGGAATGSAADNTDGGAGNAPGGGGGGAGDRGVIGNRSGGAGGAGRVVITYVITSAGPDQSLAACATSGTLAATAPSAGTGTWTCVSGCAGVTIATPTSGTSTFSGLTVPNSTTFRWTVSNAGCSSTTDDVVINTATGPLCPVYCAEGTMDCSVNDGLTNVTFATINANSTVCTNGVAATAIVTAGNTYAFSATSGTGSGNHSLAVYCDWNSNGSFADAGEFTLIANNNMTASSTRSGNITVPAGATCGATIRMRVVYTYSSVPTSANGCSNFTYGETEDYNLTISCCVPNCANGIQDCNELGIDCGGPCGAACSGVVSCTNSIMDGEETGVDCGGSVCNPCGAQCATFSNATSSPALAGDGTTVVDASAADQTITTCVEVTYSNRGTNWLHGVFMNPGSLGFVSSNATGALPEPNASTIGTTYMWRNQTANFTGSNSGNSITQNGWFVTTAAGDNNPGDNLGWPVGAGTTFGPFCFSTVVGCAGLNGDNTASMNFQTTGDSYSGAWTNADCGKESSFGANAFQYILRCPTLLPVELLAFNGYYEGRKVLLKWTTTSEINNDYFAVMKSTDGLKFTELAIVNAQTGASDKKEYLTYDNDPADPISYYKIRQVDFNGEAKESKVIAIMSPKVFDEVKVVPNPVNNIASLTFYSTQAEVTKVRITDLSGKTMFENEFESENGLNSITFETNNYNSGLYFVQISNNHDLRKIKFTVQK